MRTTLLCGAALIAATYAAPAYAEEVEGTYPVALNEVANNCEDGGLDVETGELELRGVEGGGVTASLAELPEMTGSERQGGQFRAEVRTSDSPIEDTVAEYSVAGRVRAGELEQLVLIAEYYRSERPLCTQSWNGESAE